MEEKIQDFKIKGVQHSVVLQTNDNVLRWMPSAGLDRSPKASSTEKHRVVYLHNVVKATSGKDGQEWTIHHAARKKLRSSVVMETFGHEDSQVCQEWIDAVNKQLKLIEDQRRPKKILVFINPLSGRHKGVDIYNKQIKPLFALADIETEVIVTEDANHAAKVLGEYDISSIDGIASAGGDGTLMQVVNGLQRRLMKDAGKNIDDLEETLATTQLRIGILATGTGQGMCATFNGTKDVVTSALAIIFGEEIPLHLMTAHNGGKLVAYMTLMACTGYLADTAVDAESRRSLGPFRYLISMTKQLIQGKNYEAEFYYLDDTEDNPSQEGAAASNWKEMKGKYKTTACMIYELFRANDLGREYGRLFAYITGKRMATFTISERASRLQFLKKLICMIRGSNDLLNDDLCEYFTSKAIKLVLPPGESDGKPQFLNLDGEFYATTDPEVHLRFHGGVQRAFYLARADTGERVTEPTPPPTEPTPPPTEPTPPPTEPTPPPT